MPLASCRRSAVARCSPTTARRWSGSSTHRSSSTRPAAAERRREVHESSARRSSLRSSRVVLGTAVVAWGGMVGGFWQITADDAYIPARYGRNLADTGSFVFNAGERISAMTSPFEGLLATGLHLLFGSSVTAIKVLSVAAVLGSAIAGAFSLRKTPWMALGFLVTLLLSPFVAVWTVGGLETPFLLALVTALVLIVRASEGELGQRRTALLSVVM